MSRFTPKRTLLIPTGISALYQKHELTSACTYKSSCKSNGCKNPTGSSVKFKFPRTPANFPLSDSAFATRRVLSSLNYDSSALRRYRGRAGRAPGAIFIRAVAALLSAHQDFIPDPIPRHWPDDHAVEMLTRAATSPAMITGSGWADSLAATALPDFLLNIGPASAGSTLLKRCLSLTFNSAAAIKVPSINTAASPVGFVGEGGPIPAQQLSITAGVTLAPRILSTIVVFTCDIFQHSTPSIEALVRAVLSEDIGLKLDSALFDTTAGDATRPAGLLVGISATSPAAAGDFAMSIHELLRTGIADFCSHREPLRDYRDPPQTYPLERRTSSGFDGYQADLGIRRFMPEPRSQAGAVTFWQRFGGLLVFARQGCH